MRRRADVIAAVALVVTAVAYTVGFVWRAEVPDQPRVSYDIYAAQYPSMLYAVESLRRGYGLLWNPFQNCGQPFLPTTLTGLLYPPDWLFFVLDPDTTYYVITALHLAIGGTFTFLLCREYDLGTSAALSGGLAFMLGGSALKIVSWQPATILGPYVWLPAGFWIAERILKRPSLGSAFWLGTFLTLGLLPGYPQVLLFTYQLIALRTAWELVTNRNARRVAVLAALALGLVLPAVLGAAYLFPSIEFVRESIRGRALSIKEINPLDYIEVWQPFRLSAGAITNALVPLYAIVPTALAALAVLDRPRWRVTFFQAFVVAVCMGFAFNQNAFEWYRMLPMGNTFRDPMRLTWVANFGASVLVAIGAQVGLRAVGRSLPRAIVLAVGLVLGLLLFASICLRPFTRLEWTLLGLVAAGIVTAAVLPRTRRILTVVLPVAVAVNLYTMGTTPFMARLVHGQEVFYRHADAFEFLRGRMSVQDRMYVLGAHQDYSLTSKVASLFRLPTIDDYEPQTSQRFADLTVLLFTGGPMKTINFFMYRLNAMPLRWPLFDLLATRYLVMDPAGSRFNFPLKPALHEVWSAGPLRILENPDALPRALWVPALELMRDPAALLQRLASGQHDPRQTALVDEAPADGFLGQRGAGSGQVTSLDDRAETVTLNVHADADGFVVLADQYYPGWQATVNDVSVPILRANYAFRAVRVPAGESRVVFNYRPASVRGGVLVSILSMMAVGIVGVRARRGRGVTSAAAPASQRRSA